MAGQQTSSCIKHPKSSSRKPACAKPIARSANNRQRKCSPAHEAVGQQHLHLLVVRGGVANCNKGRGCKAKLVGWLWRGIAQRPVPISYGADRLSAPFLVPNAPHKRTRIGAGVLVVAAPLVAAGCELVRGEGHGAGGEGAGDEDAPLAVPALVALQHLGVRRHVLRAGRERVTVGVAVMVVYTAVGCNCSTHYCPHMCCAQHAAHSYLGRHLRRLVGLGVQPAQRLQVSQVVMLRQCGRQVDLGRAGSVSSTLGRQASYHGECQAPLMRGPRQRAPGQLTAPSGGCPTAAASQCSGSP